jgi:hypothetical protein
MNNSRNACCGAPLRSVCESFAGDRAMIRKKANAGVAIRTKARTPEPTKWRDVLPIHPAAEAFPRMTESDFRMLVEDIKEHGLNVPVALLQNSRDGSTLLLDGISRLDALESIGVQLVRKGRLIESYDHDRKRFQIAAILFDTECDPSAVVLSLNAHRRHLTLEQKREIIGKLLKASPEKSDRQLARITGVSHPHVGMVRRSLEQKGDVETVSTSIDTKGRKQPRKRLARVERLESTAHRLEHYDLATLSVDAFIGAGREERRRFLDGIGLDTLLDAMSADMLSDLHKRLAGTAPEQARRKAAPEFHGTPVPRSHRERRRIARHFLKLAPSSTGGEGAVS